MNILITGGASGLGLHITEKLARDKNMLVYFTYNDSKQSATYLEKKYSNVKSIKLDFTDDDQTEAFIKNIYSLDIDVLINNAITGLILKKFHSIKQYEILDSFKYNVLVPVEITKACINSFRRKKNGHIINILSESLISKSTSIGFSEYNSGKAYIEAMSKSWESEYRNIGLKVINLYPKMMKTQIILKNFDERLIENYHFQDPDITSKKIYSYLTKNH